MFFFKHLLPFSPFHGLLRFACRFSELKKNPKRIWTFQCKHEGKRAVAKRSFEGGGDPEF